jgi:autotransporter-associated beta strand protein
MLRATALLVPALLAASPMAALAQDATWLANPPTNQFNSAPNWTAGVPTGTATFDASTTTAISLAPGAVTIGGFQFDAGAPAYSFTGTSGLTFTGTGIVNNSANAPAISMTGASVLFSNASSAGNATVTLNGNGGVNFTGTSSGGTARLVLNANTGIGISGLTASGTGVGSVEGAGSVVLGAKQLTTGGNNLSTTLSGGVSGSGGSLVKEGSGTLTLTGANTHTGGTTVSAGALQIGNGGTSGTIAGSIANNATLIFNRSDTLTINGTISGSGAVTQAGAGTTHLTANNSFAGTTTISAGTLQLGSNQAAGATTGALGSGDVVNNAALRVHRQNASTIAGNISGTGTLTNTGVGTVTLLGNNSYSGTTTITSGTVQIGNGGTTGTLGTGNVVNNSAFTGLLFNRSDTITVANNISGTGGLAKGGSGTTILTGTNSYANTTVGSGTLQIGDGGTAGNLGTGSVTNNGTLAFNRSDDITITNAISGSGSLNKLGTNTLVLTGNNTSTGGTTISGGTLQAGNGGTTGGIGSGATTNNGSLVFNRSNNLVVSSAISGSGTLTKLGAGMIELSGNNSYTGTTTISAGILSIGRGSSTGAIAGDIVNNAQLFIARNNDYTYAGSISGTGSVSTTDAGTTTLTGTNSYAGTTTIGGAGVLQIGNGGTTGTLGTGSVVVTASTLRFNRSDAVSIANAISGTGNVNHAGSGTTTLTGTNT